MTARRRKYLYCLLRSDRPLELGRMGVGVPAAQVRTVLHRGLAAVVSDVLGPVPQTRENLLAHQRVTESVMREHPVLPVSFGTVFESGQEVLELLRGAHRSFAGVLERVRHTLELGLKVLWDPEQVAREIEAGDPTIRKLKAEISGQKGSTYFARTQYGRLLDATLHGRSEHYAGEIYRALRPVSLALRAHKPIGEKMILNAAFLVSREREEELDRAVEQLKKQHPELTLRYTGPWPPYSFASIRLNLARGATPSPH